jgi:hypothetical protein
VARLCSICQHPGRHDIDGLLVRGTPIPRITAEFRDISADALDRHRRSHLPALLRQAREAEQVAEAETLLGQLRGLQARTLDLLAQAEAAGKLNTAVMAVREARGNLELMARLTGELNEKAQTTVQVAVLAHPEWLALRGVILATLAPHPAARQALAERLAEFDPGGLG